MKSKDEQPDAKSEKQVSKKGDSMALLGGLISKGVILFMFFAGMSMGFQFLKLYEVSVQSQKIEAQIKLEQHNLLMQQMSGQIGASSKAPYTPEELAKLKEQVKDSQSGLPNKLPTPSKNKVDGND